MGTYYLCVYSGIETGSLTPRAQMHLLHAPDSRRWHYMRRCDAMPGPAHNGCKLGSTLIGVSQQAWPSSHTNCNNAECAAWPTYSHAAVLHPPCCCPYFDTPHTGLFVQLVLCCCPHGCGCWHQASLPACVGVATVLLLLVLLSLQLYGVCISMHFDVTHCLCTIFIDKHYKVACVAPLLVRMWD